jgi:hypothetical protein
MDWDWENETLYCQVISLVTPAALAVAAMPQYVEMPHNRVKGLRGAQNCMFY